MDLGDADIAAFCSCCCESIAGRERSVEEPVSVCESHPERRDGKSEKRLDDDEVYPPLYGPPSDTVLIGLWSEEDENRERGAVEDAVLGGSTIVGGAALSSFSFEPNILLDLRGNRCFELDVAGCDSGADETGLDEADVGAP